VKDFAAKGVAVTAAEVARQDGRADGGGDRPGEGGDLKTGICAFEPAFRSRYFSVI
jgi:hypothetical protein